MTRHIRWLLGAIALSSAVIAATLMLRSDAAPVEPVEYLTETEIKQALFDVVQPIRLANCDLERFGEDNDGGYLMCGNLLDDVQAGYSYGISGYDDWGCDVSTRLDVAVQQYDCFDTRQPVCLEADTRFHEECVSGTRHIEEGRLFDTISSQIAGNGDSGKRLVLKIDVEGAEWGALLHTPDEVLQRVDQIAAEFHGIEEERFIGVINHLRRFFYVAHLHYNNNSCSDWLVPFPAWVYEVLFVSKRLGIPEEAGAFTGPHPLDMPNNPDKPDCQGTPPGLAKLLRRDLLDEDRISVTLGFPRRTRAGPQPRLARIRRME